jgi:predicted ABC-type transport system involved in lysophospholipase L1 biosynthesis ATPase subunit
LGESVNSKSTDNYLADLRLRKIGFVFQTFNLIATMSAFENVELPMTLLGKYGILYLFIKKVLRKEEQNQRTY